MVIQALDTTTDVTVDLLVRYIFDLGGASASDLLDRWLKDYPANWVRLAVIEALYQGRYKAVSIEQILTFWQRRGQAVYHFNHEFERLVCGNFSLLPGQSQINTNIPLVSEKTASSNSGYNEPTAAVAEIATEIQLIDATTKTPPSTKSSSKEIGRYYPRVDNYQGLRLFKSENPCPIEQFIPKEESGSDFHSKLKAIAQAPED